MMTGKVGRRIKQLRNEQKLSQEKLALKAELDRTYLAGAEAFAFAEENGIDLFLGDPDFSDYIKTHKYELAVGTDSITDPKAVTRLRAYCKLYHNLTERGLYHNIEMYSYNALSNTDFTKLKIGRQDWLDYSINHNLIFDRNDPIIDHAVNRSAAKKAKSFSASISSTGKTVAPDSSLLALYKAQPQSISVRKPVTVPMLRKTKAKPKKSSAIIATPIPAVVPAAAAPTI